MFMPFWRYGAGQSDQSLPRTGYGVGFAPVVQLPVPMGLGPVLQHPFQPLFGEAPLDPVYGAQGQVD